MKLANSDQKNELISNYAINDKEKIKRVKEIYDELNLKEKFEEYEKISYEKLKEKIKNQNQLPEDVFMTLLNKIYKRKK